jgi:tRNA pseudouridine38-40 synthase
LRYFFHIAYLGTHYNGWQKNPDAHSVQAVLEKALSQILKIPTYIVGCGRTDAHVHASQFFFHMDADEAWDYDLLFRLNKLLPNDIAVFDIIPMTGLPHARFDAIERSYNYFIHPYKDPFLNHMSAQYAIKDWDMEQMQRAASLLLRYNDYHAFCATPNKNEHTICNISAASFFSDNTGDKLRFHISANRFLGKMVRTIIGKLIDIGTGKLSVDQFEQHLINPLLPQEIKPAYPQGLHLSKIVYPYLNMAPKSIFSQMLLGEASAWKSVRS